MSTQLMTQADITDLITLDVNESKKTVAQMTSIMNMIASEKEISESKLSMMEKQKWYKKMWFTITGKNKATVKEISECKDKIAAYTSQAVAVLFENSKIEQMQIVSLGNSVNYLGSQLVATNFALLQTQEAMAQFKNDILKSVRSLANALNEKIESVDNFHILEKEIEQGAYDFNNVMASMFCVMAQLDRRMVADGRKMNILKNALAQKGILSDNEITLSEIMMMFAQIPDEYLGVVYGELSCNIDNQLAYPFTECMERYALLPRMDKKAKKPDKIIANILEANDMDGDAPFTTNEIYDCFFDSKTEFLSGIREITVNCNENQKTASENDRQTITEDISSSSDINDIRRAAENGSAEAQFELGEFYYNDKEKEPDYKEAVKWYRKAAEQHYTEAEFMLGKCYYFGKGIDVDYYEAVKWYRLAADKEYAKAQNNLGTCYSEGRGVEKDEIEAFKWYHLAAENGSIIAQYNLGNCYYYGDGVEEDIQEAIKWYRMAAEKGNADAQYELGEYYQMSSLLNNSVEDEQQSIKWFRMAAEQGNAQGQCKLGDCYFDGFGVCQDMKEAVKWYRKAAEWRPAEPGSNVPDFYCYLASNKLGDCYKNGYGVKKNEQEAEKWYKMYKK